MPIYEYICRTCGHLFEQIVFSSAIPACPSCRSTELEKQPSVFAAQSVTPGPPKVRGRKGYVSERLVNPACPVNPQDID